MNPHAFLADLERKPEALASLDAVLGERPWSSAITEPVDRVVLLGMGSSRYAADVAAARLRAAGVTAIAELASTDLLPRWGRGTLVVAISASGASRETLDALERLDPDATVVTLTNTPDSALAERASATVLLEAGTEEGGVACRSFQHTLALLLSLEAELLGRSPEGLRRHLAAAATATAHLLDTRATWVPAVSELLFGPDGTHVVAPARRLSSARQSALMLREAPRVPAVACEAGDWAHVDVYLTKNTDYRLLSYAGSRWDAGILEWTRPRETAVVSVGGELDGAAFVVRYPGDDADDVRLLTETLVAEVVAAQTWIDQG